MDDLKWRFVCLLIVVNASIIVPCAAWDFATTSQNFEANLLVESLNAELTSLDTACAEYQRQNALVSDKSLNERKSSLKEIFREFDYVMHKNYGLFGERPAHPNRAYMEQFEKELDMLTTFDVDVSLVSHAVDEMRSTLSSLLLELKDLQTQLGNLGGHSDFLSAVSKAKKLQELLNSLTNTIQTRLPKLVTCVSPVNSEGESCGQVWMNQLQSLDKKYLEKMTIKYPEKPDEKYRERFSSSVSRAAASLSSLLRAFSRFVQLNSSLSTHHLLKLAEQILSHIAGSEEVCLNSEAFRKAIIDGDLAPRSASDSFWSSLKHTCETRQQALVSLRESNEQERRAFESSQRAQADNTVSRTDAARRELLGEAGAWLEKVKQVSTNVKESITSDLFRPLPVYLKRIGDLFWSDVSAFESFARKNMFDLDQTDGAIIKIVKAHLSLGSALQDVSQLYMAWISRSFPAELIALNAFHSKWVEWLGTQDTASPEEIMKGIQHMRSESVRLSSRLFVMLPESMKYNVLFTLRQHENPMGDEQDIEQSVSTPSALIQLYHNIMSQSFIFLESLGQRRSRAELASQRQKILSFHENKMTAIKDILKNLRFIASAVDLGMTDVKDILVTSPKTSLSDEALRRIISSPNPALIVRPTFRPSFEEPNHELATLRCFRGAFFAALSAGSKDPDFIDCTMKMSNVRPDAIKVALAEFDESFNTKVENARSSDELFRAFRDALSAGAYISPKAFTDKASALRIRQGLFAPTAAKMALFEAEKFNPGAYYPYNNPELMYLMARSGVSLQERRLSTLEAGVEALTDRYLSRRGSAQTIGKRRRPVLVKWIGEQGVDVGGLRAEFFSSMVDALMTPEGGLVADVENNDKVVFAPVASSASAKQQQERKASLLGFIMGWAYFNKVALALKLPLVYYHHLRQMIRTHVSSAPRSFIDESVDYSRFLLMDLQGIPNYRQSIFATSTFYLGEDSPAAQEHMQLYCVDTFLFNKDIDDTVPKETIIRATASSVQDAIDAAAKNSIHDMAFRQSLSLANKWGESFIKMFTDEELVTLASLRIDELQTLFGPYPDINVDLLRSKVAIYGDNASANRVDSTREFSKTKTVQAFWKMMESFTPQQRKLTVEFWTGQSNVPDGLEFNKWTIYLRNQSEGWKLPQAHTCFNNIELFHCPSDRNEEQCQELLTSAFTIAWSTIGRFDIR